MCECACACMCVRVRVSLCVCMSVFAYMCAYLSVRSVRECGFVRSCARVCV